MASMEEIRKSQRAKGLATVLAIGTALPVNCFYQAGYPDYFFRVTNNEHLTELKRSSSACEKSMIKKRYMHLTEEIMKEKTNIATFKAPSLNERQDIVAKEVPKLGQEAAMKAIKEWGRPMSQITHLVFCTTSGVHMPGADYQPVKLLGLSQSVKRLMLYQQGCYGGGTVLRVAKDLVENNVGARVMERPLFQLVSASQKIVPDSEHMIEGHLREMGLLIHLSQDLPMVASINIEEALQEAFGAAGGGDGSTRDWNSIFWVVHAGGRAILDQIEAKLGLEKEKLGTARHILSEYGNTASACVLFVLDEMRKRSIKEGNATTGDGLDWGVLMGLGPGLTLELMVSHRVPC